MQNWTTELIGTNHEDVQNANERMQRRKVHPGLLNTTVKIQFPVLEVYQMLSAKSSLDVPGVQGRGEVCKYPICTTARGRTMGLGTFALGL